MSDSSDAKLERLIRQDASKLMDYSSVKPLDVLAAELGLPISELCKLDANENLYGPHPAVEKALAESVATGHIYPDPMQGHLLDRLTGYTGFSRDEIVCGAGADELIDLVLRVMMPEKIIVTPPTFAMYKFFALIGRAETVEVPLDRLPDGNGFQVNMDKVIESVRSSKATVTFITSPNNPTGLCVPVADVERLLAEDTLVVVDEAYIEFAPKGMGVSELLRKYSNLAILRTFSKWAGLAGMRLGYMIARPFLVNKVRQIKIPYNVSVAAEAAGCAALDNLDSVNRTVQLMCHERTRLTSFLKSVGLFKPMLSHSNFVLCEVASGAGFVAKDFHAKMRSKGILLRFYPNLAYFGQFVRISTGRPEDTDRLMAEMVQEAPAEVRAKVPAFAHARNMATALLWDMDGVMADVSKSYRTAIIQAAKYFGVETDNKEISEYKLKGGANNDWVLTRRIIEAKIKGDVPSLEDVTNKFQEYYLGTGSTPGLRDTESLMTPADRLRALSKRVPMAVVTGRPREEAQYFLKLHGISDCFSALACMEDSPCKPDPFPLLKAMKDLAPKLGPGPHTYYMIGDTVDDSRAAIAANAKQTDGTVIMGLGILAPNHGTLESNATEVAGLFASGCIRVYDSTEDLLNFIDVGTIGGVSNGSPKRPVTGYPASKRQKTNL